MADIDDFWTVRPVHQHIQQFAQARRVAPLALLVSLIVRAIAATSYKVVLPPTIGSVASLNMAAALVGVSGNGKGATVAAARDATNLPAIPELPIGSGEGIARTFETDKDGVQEIPAAIFTASEIDGLAALASRQGATIMAVIRQLYSGESIGSANAQKHTRLIIPAHAYRACLELGVQPERAAPLLSDTAGTAQRILWVPVRDPDAPDIRPDEPPRREITRIVAPNVQKALTLPAIAVSAIERHHLAKLRGDEDIDPLDGHKMLTRAKMAAGLMILDDRLDGFEISAEDWELAGVLMAVSDRTRAQIAAAAAETAKRANRARALATAEREETIDGKRLDTVKRRVLTVLGKGRTASGKLRAALGRREYRDLFDLAITELEAVGHVQSVAEGKATFYERSGLNIEHPVQPINTQLSKVEHGLNIEQSSKNVTRENVESKPEHETEGQPVDTPHTAPRIARPTVCTNCFAELAKAAQSDLCDECDDGTGHVMRRSVIPPEDRRGDDWRADEYTRWKRSEAFGRLGSRPEKGGDAA